VNLDERVAVVTGGARGIGLTIVDRLARAGAKVVLCDVDEALAADSARAICDGGGEAMAVFADVTDVESVKNMVATTLDRYGRIDILVNNAGIVADGLLLRMTNENWQKVLDIDLTGVFNCTKLVARTMLKQRYGRIVTIGSVVGIIGNPGQANYCAAKAGVIGLTKAVARELGNRGVTANVVAPGFIETEMTAQLNEEQTTRILDGVVLGRLGTPADVAECVLFLASDSASYITGQVVRVDGGLNM